MPQVVEVEFGAAAFEAGFEFLNNLFEEIFNVCHSTWFVAGIGEPTKRVLTSKALGSNGIEELVFRWRLQ